jgi:deoxyribodipyrimidine photolyase
MWRDFAWHLLWNAPRMETEHWRADFEGFLSGATVPRPSAGGGG